MAATNILGRLSSSIGGLTFVEPNFTASLDVPYGGVLLALPALLSCGLLTGVTECFNLPNGYYGLESIFLLLGFMALARIKSMEDLRYCAPGEWGKLLGLDRIPEVKTLRGKVEHLSKHGNSEAWNATLCKKWMYADSTSNSMVLYIDAHVRVYNGSQTKLPKHFISREKLCLRAAIDYWINAMDGQPFFYINKEVDPGLLKVLDNEIIPWLEREIPDRTSQEQLDNDKLLHKLTVIYDREGYSPIFMKKMKDKRIACITYNKYPKDDWPIDEFSQHSVTTTAGNLSIANLAERGVQLSNKLWVREIRRLKGTHQTSILSTDYHSDLTIIAVQMSDRWCQENFFRYMRQHYNLDRLVAYSTEKIADTIKVVNPEYRKLDGEVRRLAARHSRRLAEFGVINLNSELKPDQVESYQSKKAKLLEEIQDLQNNLETTKKQRKETAKHITIAELPEKDRFNKLETNVKHFLDTIKMVSYRAETAMYNLLSDVMVRAKDDGRSLLRAIYQTSANLIPDKKNNTLTVHIHHLANHCSDKVIQYLVDELNETETIFPGTKMKLIYKLGTT